MNEKLKEQNRIKKRNALAEKILIAMVSNGQWCGICFRYNKILEMERLLEVVYDIADSFIKHSESHDNH